MYPTVIASLRVVQLLNHVGNQKAEMSGDCYESLGNIIHPAQYFNSETGTL